MCLCSVNGLSYKKEKFKLFYYQAHVSCMATYHQVGWNPKYTKKKHLEGVQKTPPKLTFHVLSRLK